MRIFLSVVVFLFLLVGCAATQPGEIKKAEPVVRVPPNCGSQEHIAEHLAQIYNEKLVVLGLSPGVVTEWYGSPDGGSWSLVTTTLSKISCVVGGGDRWAEAEPMK